MTQFKYQSMRPTIIFNHTNTQMTKYSCTPSHNTNPCKAILFERMCSRVPKNYAPTTKYCQFKLRISQKILNASSQLYDKLNRAALLFTNAICTNMLYQNKIASSTTKKVAYKHKLFVI